ncbi:uncharacterized protein LOC116347884 isoform X2 [Contarinia nasturtii]|uniref:uncharacterized protein LOC116347884 isoform X2 n=1 Tax=Contarinia nasturtii TaxID=265458 RepID=UPI0012D436A0|nr:uncharacterized protein LOC116347884 isoform X2 [Contarinia nasturtii]
MKLINQVDHCRILVNYLKKQAIEPMTSAQIYANDKTSAIPTTTIAQDVSNFASMHNQCMTIDGNNSTHATTSNQISNVYTHYSAIPTTTVAKDIPNVASTSYNMNNQCMPIFGNNSTQATTSNQTQTTSVGAPYYSGTNTSSAIPNRSKIREEALKTVRTSGPISKKACVLLQLHSIEEERKLLYHTLSLNPPKYFSTLNLRLKELDEKEKLLFKSITKKIKTD